MKFFLPPRAEGPKARSVAVVTFSAAMIAVSNVTSATRAFGAEPETARGPSEAAIVLVFKKVKNDRGSIRCRIYRGKEGFPMKDKQSIAKTTCRPKDKRAVCTFKKLPAGTYAAACYHDENGNKDLDTNFLGIPTEGVAASNNATGTIGPPSWNDAKFVFTGGSLSQVLEIDY